MPSKMAGALSSDRPTVGAAPFMIVLCRLCKSGHQGARDRTRQRLEQRVLANENRALGKREVSLWISESAGEKRRTTDD
jgi:hypothetical protein